MKYQNYKRIMMIFSLIFFFSSVSADDMTWTLSSEDTSYQYLLFLFGNVSSDLVCSGSNCSILIPQLFKLMNQGILSIGTLVLTYVFATSIGSSAGDGEFLGKKGSGIWLPARMTAGMAFLVPTTTGYSLLQTFIMKVILFGIVLANNIYGLLGSYVQQYNTSFGKENAINEDSLTDLINDLTDYAQYSFERNLCSSFLSYTTMQSSMMNSTYNMTPYFWTCSKGDGSTSSEYFGEAFSYENFSTDIQTYLDGHCPLDQSYSSTTDATMPKTSWCGGYSMSYLSDDKYPASTQAILKDLTQNMANIASNFVYKACYSCCASISASGDVLTTNQYTNTCIADPEFSDEKAAISDAIYTAYVDMLDTHMPEVELDTSTITADWLLFPLNFYDWLSKTGNGSATISSIDKYKAFSKKEDYEDSYGGQSYYSQNGDYSSTLAYYNSNKNDLFNKEDINNAITGSDPFVIKAPSSNSGPTYSLYNEMKKMSSGNNEPLIELAKYGQTLIQTAYDAILSSIMVGVALIAATSIWSSIQPAGVASVWTSVIGFFMSAMLSLGFLIPIGATLGIYLPMIPLGLYSLSVLNWFMMVIESMVAGPVIALGLMAPGQDSMGKAQPAVIMLFSIFLKPALMVLGVVFGAKLFDLFCVYFTNAFLSGFDFLTSQSNTDSSWYGLIFFIFWYFYAFAMVGLAQRCYSMIYILPDKVISWIEGGQATSSRDIVDDLKTMQKGIDQGADSLKSQMSSVGTGALAMSKSLKDINTKKNTDTGGGGTPTT